jgi:addiction module HigA family antidote
MLYRHVNKTLRRIEMGAFPPGKLIREELEARGWTQKALAERMDRPVQTISMIINGRKAITAETALQLQDAFGASAGMWMGLEADWQLYKESERQKAQKAAVNKIRASRMSNERIDTPKPKVQKLSPK